MAKTYRNYIEDENLEAFKAGFDESLNYKAGVEVIALSIRTIFRTTNVVALIGIVGKAGGRNFELPLPKDELTRARWTALGAEIGRAVDGWLTPRFQDPLQAQAAADGSSVWDIHPLEELAEDAVMDWEATWKAHLNGLLHPKAKRALIDLIAAHLLDVVEKMKPIVAEAEPAPLGEPCGECHLQPGETCDICGRTAAPSVVTPPAPKGPKAAKKAKKVKPEQPNGHQ